jgi:hypothetical protein
MPFYAVFDNEKAIGFVAIKIHNAYTVQNTQCVYGRNLCYGDIGGLSQAKDWQATS